MLIGDDTFVAAPAEVVAAAIAEPGRWQAWWSDLTLQVSRDRGVKGHQWMVTGAYTGTAEIWLEPWHDGTILHLIQRLDPVPPSRAPRSPKAALREESARVIAWKRHASALKDELER